MNIFVCDFSHFLSQHGLQIEYIAAVTIAPILYLIFSLSINMHRSYNKQALRIYQKVNKVVINMMRIILISHAYFNLIKIDCYAPCYLRLAMLIYLLEIVDLVIYALIQRRISNYRSNQIICFSLLMFQCFYGNTFLPIVIMHINYQSDLLMDIINYYRNKKINDMVLQVSTRTLCFILTFVIYQLSIMEMIICTLVLCIFIFGRYLHL